MSTYYFSRRDCGRAKLSFVRDGQTQLSKLGRDRVGVATIAERTGTVTTVAEAKTVDVAPPAVLAGDHPIGCQSIQIVRGQA